MAKMIPDVDTEKDFLRLECAENAGGAAEWFMYQELRALPDSYTVIHSYPYEYAKEGGERERGEADFVVLGPPGVLVVEVKKSSLYYVPDFGWSPKKNPKKNKDKPRRNPFEQARDEMDAVVVFLKGTKGDDGQDIIWRKDVVCNYCVAFPTASYGEGRTGLGDMVSRLIVDRSDLDRNPIDRLVARLFQHQSEYQDANLLRQLSAREIGRAVERLLPQIRPMPAGLDVTSAAVDHATMGGLQTLPTFDDRNAYGRFSLQKGVAGSGKTLLATRWARQAAEEGQRVLFLCFNRMLAEWLKSDPANGGFDIFTFHGLSEDRARHVGIPWGTADGSPETAVRGFYEGESPRILLEATEALSRKNHKYLYDVVIVDEGQDIRRGWWKAVFAQLQDGEAGELHVVYDREQMLFDKDCGVPEDLERLFRKSGLSHPLKVNLRNSRSIVGFVSMVKGWPLSPSVLSPEGVLPEVVSPKGGDVVGEFESLVGRLQREKIGWNHVVVMSDHRMGSEHHVLRGRNRVAGVPILDFDGKSDLSRVALDGWTKGEGLLVTTPRSFKGLEADVVILLGMSDFRETFTESDLYVAMTRAKCRLYAICREGEVLDRLKKGLEAD